MKLAYIATPYSVHPKGLDAAFVLACREAGLFAAAGLPAYSPIAACHGIAVICGLNPYDYKIWLPFNEPMMQAASHLVVVEADGWEASPGIKAEIEQFEAAGKPIIKKRPGTLPELP